jgi:hypothetical protein
MSTDRHRELTLIIGSQPTYRLRPYQSRTFFIGKFEGFRVEFRRGSASVGCGASLSMVFELAEAAEKSWHRRLGFREPPTRGALPRA